MAMRRKTRLVVAVLLSCLLYTLLQMPSADLATDRPDPRKLSFGIQGSTDLRRGEDLLADGRKEVSEFLWRQKQAQISIDAYCQNNSESLPVFEEGFTSILYDQVNNLSYCSIYKVASTSWAIALLTLRGKWQNDGIKRVRNLLDKVFVKFPHRDAPKKTEYSTRFMIVRHPFERLISAYRDKFENANKAEFYFQLGEKMVKKFRPPPEGKTPKDLQIYLKKVRNLLKGKRRTPVLGNPYTNPFGPTFEEFVKFVVSGERDDDHWRPYYIQCSLCYMTYDYILRFETLTRDSNAFIEVINMTDKLATRWENPTSAGATTQDISCDYFGNLTQSLGLALTRKYKHDLDMFRYSEIQYMKCIPP